MKSFLNIFAYVPLCLAVVSLSGCSGIESEAKYPTGADRAIGEGDIYSQPEGIFGRGGLALLGGNSKGDDNGIGVNSYLWRASLDTISFMPLDNADPFGGVITTNWYSTSEAPNERLKLNVLILSKTLKSDGIKIKVFKQQKSASGWKDVPVSVSTERELEDAVLTRARQLRVSDLK